jgi:hypothetical protein
MTSLCIVIMREGSFPSLKQIKGAISMKEQAQKWYKENIQNPAELDKKIKATLEYLKRFNEPEQGDWVVFAYETTSGSHGQYTIRTFLDEVLSPAQINRYMLLEDMDDILGTYDALSDVMARLFQEHSKLSGKFYMGTNEADGSLGVFYYEKAQ